MALEIGRGLLGLRRTGRQAFAQGGEFGVEGFQCPQATSGFRQGVAGRAPPFHGGVRDQPSQGLGTLFAQLGGVREPRARNDQVGHLLGHQLRIVDLGQLVGEEVLALDTLPALLAQRRDFVLEAPRVPVALRQRGTQLQKVALAVEQAAVNLTAAESLGIVLAGDFQAARKEFCQCAHRHQLPGDPRAAATARKATRHHQLVILAGEFSLREQDLEVGQRLGAEDRLDAGLALLVSQGARRRASPRQQGEPAQHDGLAGARLPRAHVEAGPEVQLRLLHDGKAFDPQRLDQGALRRCVASRPLTPCFTLRLTSAPAPGQPGMPTLRMIPRC